MRKIDTYERFERHIRAWSEREIGSVMVVGTPGTGKSETYKHVLGKSPYHLISGRKTPIQAYCQIYDAPGLPVIFDDVSALLSDRNFLDLMKGLCETDHKVVRWGTSTRLLENRSTSFEFSAPALVVLNRLPEKNQDVMAILDRCDSVQFSPTKLEILAKMRAIWPNEERLIDLMAELPVLPTLRTMVKARRWKRSRYLNMNEELLSECGVPEPVRALIDIMSTSPKNKWSSLYVERTGKTKRTYRRHKKLADQVMSSQVISSQGGGQTDTPIPMRSDSPPHIPGRIAGAA